MSEMVVTLTVDQLKDVMRDVLDERAREAANESDFLTRETAAKLLDITDRTLIAWVERDGLPGMKLPGGEWRFRRSEILSWLAKPKPSRRIARKKKG